MNIASYVSSSSFRVPGDRESTYKAGLKVKLYQAPASTVECSVVSSTYDGTGLTVVVVEDGSVAPSLAAVALGPTYPNNTGKHGHTAYDDGGLIPASAFSATQVATLQTIDTPVSGDAGKILITCPTFSDGFQLAALLGTTNQVTVTIIDEQVTLSIPQNIHTGASPTFAGLTLSGLTGIIEAKGATAVGIVAADAALKVLKRNAGNNAYEFAFVAFSELSDVDLDSVAEDDILVQDSEGNWINLGKGSDGEALIVDPFTHHVTWGTPSLDLGELTDADVSGVQNGDMLVRTSGEWKLLAKGVSGQFLRMVGSAPQWIGWPTTTTTLAPTTTTAAPTTTTSV